MANPAPPISAAELLEHQAWIRRLARSLLRDEHAAEDAAQDALRAALERPPAERKNLRGWLGAVVRNAALQIKRSEQARAARERRAARGEALPSAVELVEQAELLRELAGHVVELAEPYRSVLMLRYFSGLAPREIARKRGVSVNTVRSQLARALARLRERMDSRHGGDRSAWTGLLLPMASKGPAALAGWMEVAAMSLQAKLATAAAAAALIGALAWWPLRNAGDDVVTADAPAPLAAPAPQPAVEPAPGANVEAPAGTREAVAAPRTDGPGLLLYGSLTDSQGGRVAAGRLHFEDEQAEIRTAEVATPGSYSIVGLQPGAWKLYLRCDGYCAQEQDLELPAGVDTVRRDLVLERAESLYVRFAGPDGATLEHEKLALTAVASLDPPPRQLAGVQGRDASMHGVGRFRAHRSIEPLADLPEGFAGRLDLAAPLPLYVSAVMRNIVLETRIVGAADGRLEFVLDPERLQANLASLRLRVIDASSGAPLAGRVELTNTQQGGGGTALGPDGSVAFEERAPGLLELNFRVEGYESLKSRVRLEPGEAKDLGTVALSPATTIRGRVVDREGKPVAGSIEQVSLAHLKLPQDVETRFFRPLDGDGRFEVEDVARGQVLLIVRPKEAALTPVVIDTRSAQPEELVITVEAGIRASFRLARPSAGRRQVTLATADGTPFWTRGLLDFWIADVRLGAGRYQLWIGTDERVERVETLEVGAEPVKIAVE
ncbi:MAG TPA: sigma-70 family RNA polymerase sigma factor [Planctomycetota bacterium]|nr:sigma-70 family RNA polymerase sigma factor [Planctomycetota bacterium]